MENLLALGSPIMNCRRAQNRAFTQIAAVGWQNEAAASANGATHNSLYFDWHVNSFRGTSLASVVP